MQFAKSPAHPTSRRLPVPSVGLLSISLLLTAWSAGCTAPHSGGSTVRVSEDPTAIFGQSEPPEQRLATTRTETTAAERTTAATGTSRAAGPEDPRVPSARAGKVAVGMPEVFRETEREPTARTVDRRAQSQVSTGDRPSSPRTDNPRTDKSKTSISVTRSLSAGPESPTRVSQSNVSSTHSDTSDEAVEVTVGGLVSASLTDLTDTPTAEASVTEAPDPAAESMNAAATSQPPRLQRTSHPHTDRPHPLGDALRNSLTDLPDLPETTGESAAGSPHRLGVPARPVVARVGDLADTLPEGRTKGDSAIRTASHESAKTLSPRGPKTAAGDSKIEAPEAISATAAAAAQTLSEQELFNALIERYTDDAQQDDLSEMARQRRRLIARHLMVLSGDPEHIESAIVQDDAEYLAAHLRGLRTLIDTEGHPSLGRRITKALPHYRQATHRMASATDSLALANIEFCTEIEAYGLTTPFEGNRFTAGQQVILYCEVENFATDPEEGFYQTRLEGTYDIYDEDGKKRFSQRLPADRQRSRNALRDYFVAYQMNLPKQLAAGTYRMQLTIEDLIGKKYGQAEIPFEIR